MNVANHYSRLFAKIPRISAKRRADGHGGWIWKLGDIRRVPYRLPELIEAIANGYVIAIVEGEKDADALLELTRPHALVAQVSGAMSTERILVAPTSSSSPTMMTLDGITRDRLRQRWPE